MNPFNIRQPQDRRKVYNEYMANLQMQIDNLAKTEAAVAALKTTGAPPVQPTDTRTIAEKLLDVDKQKTILRQALLEITDGAEAGKIMNTISDEDVVFLGVAWGDFSKMIKQKFASGILTPLFKEVLQRYKRDYINGLSVQKGISAGHTTEELLLSMRELMRLMPNADQLRELNFTIQNLPAGAVAPSMKSTALAAVSSLDSMLLTQGELDAIDAMNPIDKAAAEKALNDGFSSITTGAILQGLTQKLQQASGRQVPDILSTIINDILITRDDAAQVAQAKAISEQKSAMYEVGLPETISKLEKIPMTKSSKKITESDVEIMVFIEDPAVDIDRIAKLTLPQLRGWLKIKILEGAAPQASTTEINKMGKAELLQVIDAFKSGQFKSVAPVAPVAKARKVGQPSKKVAKQVILVTVDWNKDVTLADFEKLDYADKRSMLEDMDAKGMPRNEMSVEQYKEFTDLMARNDPNEEQTLIDIFAFINKAIGGTGFKSPALRSKNILVAGGKSGVSAKQEGERSSLNKSKKITFGCGLARSLKPTLMVKPDNIDFEKGLKKEPSYFPIGKYVVNKHKLRDNMLLMRTVKGGQIAELPQMSISPKLGKMLNKIISGNGFPSHSDLTELEDCDKDILYKVFKMSKAEGIESIPRPNKSKDEQEFNRFTILKGEIMAGNNSKELVKEFKTLLVKLIHSDKILRKDAHGILLDLAALGY
jgi:hypothetical protein